MNVYASIFYTYFFHFGWWGSWYVSPAVYGREMGYSLDKSPVQQPCTLPFTPNLNRQINLAVMFLDCGRTYSYMGRTCKLDAERPPAGSRTMSFLLQGSNATNCTTVQPFINVNNSF
ncbi:hypothetical protein XENOCAPTIV_018604 [Xenoophorus captivus]|uniref:Uncharacterized protein n=1 Tax=Xenoophorus captivus TaxID=1517983 RepID=A0ABV0S2G0_9TELE